MEKNIKNLCIYIMDFPGGAVVKNMPTNTWNTIHGFSPWVGKIPWRRKWQPTPVFLPGESHGQRSLVGHSPWSPKESDTTERLHSLIHNFSIPGGSDGKESACNGGDLGLISGLRRSLGEGHGKPLQYSCLENPMDRGAWWTTVHRVTKSQTWLSD